jgi:ATP synthase protein I
MIINTKASWTFKNSLTVKALMVKKRQWKGETRKVIELTSLGLMLPSSIAVGLLIGYILDRILGTRPWLLLIFLLLGTASGLFSLLRTINRLQDENKKDTEIE